MRDREYETLISQYNTAIAQIKDLREQLSQKEAEWGKKDKANKITSDHMRKLCEHILAKNKSEMVLGKEYSWDNIGMDELIQKADKVFKEYNDQRSGDLNRMMDELERRAGVIQSLREQFDRYAATGDVNELKTADDALKEAEKEKAAAASKQKMPNKLQEADTNGEVDVIVEDDEKIAVDGEKRALEEMAEIHEQITNNSIPVIQGEKVKKFNKEIKDAATQAHLIDLVDFSKDFTDYMWKILEGIGKHGLSKYPDLEQYVMRSMQKAVQSAPRTATKALRQKKAIVETKISTPLTPSVYAYQLSETGARLYKLHFEKEPVRSELERVIAEHDNAEHGYGIMDVQKILEEKKWYTEISIYNRDNPIKIEGTNKSYIPDLICTIKGAKYKDYYEYERGHHTQSDFNAKCNKMAHITRHLLFVVPNKETLKKLKAQADVWAHSRSPESLKNLKFKIVTATELKNAKNKDEQFWQVIYNFNKGLDPVKDLE